MSGILYLLLFVFTIRLLRPPLSRRFGFLSQKYFFSALLLTPIITLLISMLPLAWGLVPANITYMCPGFTDGGPAPCGREEYLKTMLMYALLGFIPLLVISIPVGMLIFLLGRDPQAMNKTK